VFDDEGNGNGPAELSALFNDEIKPSIFNHKTVSSPNSISLNVAVSSFVDLLALETDESYIIDFADASKGIQIKSPTQLGAIHALETLSQLIYFDFETELYTLPTHCTIKDSPRFKHRKKILLPCLMSPF
jgi:N-acetyl-beta-hexosaminidase